MRERVGLLICVTVSAHVQILLCQIVRHNTPFVFPFVVLLLGHDLIPLSPGIVNRLSQFIGRMRLEIAFAIERDITTLRDPLSAWTPSKH